VVCTLIDNDTCHHSGQNVVDSLGCASLVHNILTTVMTRIVVDKSTYHTKPHLICQFEVLFLGFRVLQFFSYFIYLELFRISIRSTGFKADFVGSRSVVEDELTRAGALGCTVGAVQVTFFLSVASLKLQLGVLLV